MIENDRTAFEIMMSGESCIVELIVGKLEDAVKSRQIRVEYIFQFITRLYYSAIDKNAHKYQQNLKPEQNNLNQKYMISDNRKSVSKDNNIRNERSLYLIINHNQSQNDVLIRYENFFARDHSTIFEQHKNVSRKAIYRFEKISQQMRKQSIARIIAIKKDLSQRNGYHHYAIVHFQQHTIVSFSQMYKREIKVYCSEPLLVNIIKIESREPQIKYLRLLVYRSVSQRRYSKPLQRKISSYIVENHLKDEGRKQIDTMKNKLTKDSKSEQLFDEDILKIKMIHNSMI